MYARPLYLVALCKLILSIRCFHNYIVTEFHHLLKGEVVSYSTDDDVMISSEGSALPSTPSPDRRLITAQVEGTTLTRQQYNIISSLTCSMFYLPTGALEYVGYTVNPLTLYWYCSTDEIEGELLHSTGLLSEMAHEGMNKITKGATRQIIIPKTIVSHSTTTVIVLENLQILYICTGNKAVRCCLGWYYGVCKMCIRDRNTSGHHEACKTTKLTFRYYMDTYYIMMS